MAAPANQTEIPQEQKQSNADFNFAQLRKQLEIEKKARLEAEQRAAQLEQMRSTSAQKNTNDDDDDDSEPYVDKKTLKKVLGKWEQGIDQKIEKKAEERAAIMLERERQATFLKTNPDYNQIMTPEMIQKFADKHPEVAENLLEMPDGFARNKLVYQNIKALGIHKKEEAIPIQDTIDKNRRSPYYQPTLAGNAPPYAKTGDFSDSGQKNAYKQMQELIKNRRS